MRDGSQKGHKKNLVVEPLAALHFDPDLIDSSCFLVTGIVHREEISRVVLNFLLISSVQLEKARLPELTHLLLDFQK